MPAAGRRFAVLCVVDAAASPPSAIHRGRHTSCTARLRRWSDMGACTPLASCHPQCVSAMSPPVGMNGCSELRRSRSGGCLAVWCRRSTAPHALRRRATAGPTPDRTPHPGRNATAPCTTPIALPISQLRCTGLSWLRSMATAAVALGGGGALARRPRYSAPCDDRRPVHSYIHGAHPSASPRTRRARHRAGRPHARARTAIAFSIYDHFWIL